MVKGDEGHNYFYCLAPKCNGLRRSRCHDFNNHRIKVHSWDPITLRVGAPLGPNYRVRSQSFLKKERDRKNYNIEYQVKKKRNRTENIAIRAEMRKEVQIILYHFILFFHYLIYEIIYMCVLQAGCEICARPEY